MAPRLLALAASAAVLLALAAPAPASGQAAATPSCTASLVSSFTPCLSYITNGTGSSSPTTGCCRSLSALVNASAGCACLLLTGSVPLGVPVNRTLAVTLPRACNSTAVPLQCKDASAQLPAPGPVVASASPTMAPLPPVAPAPTSGTTGTVATPTTTSQSQGQTRPQTVPSSASAWRDGAHVPVLFVVILAVGTMLV